MKKPCTMALAALLLASPAFAQAAPEAKAKDQPAEETQQNKMKRCNAEAAKKELKGDERRAFMSSCLKG